MTADIMTSFATAASSDISEADATELQIQPIRSTDQKLRTTGTAAAVAATLSADADSNASQDDRLRQEGFWGRVTRFWNSNITVVVPGASARDHLGGFMALYPQYLFILSFSSWGSRTPVPINIDSWTGMLSR